MSEPIPLLIVDDDPDFAWAFKLALQAEGYEVDVAHSPEDGWAALKRRRYALLLLDIMMGRGAGGISLARRIRKDEVLREMPVLMITGMGKHVASLFPGLAIHPRFVRIDELVEKPIDPELLLDRVHALIAAAGARRTGTEG